MAAVARVALWVLAGGALVALGAARGASDNVFVRKAFNLVLGVALSILVLGGLSMLAGRPRPSAPGTFEVRPGPVVTATVEVVP